MVQYPGGVIKNWDLASDKLKLSLTGHVSLVRGRAVSTRGRQQLDYPAVGPGGGQDHRHADQSQEVRARFRGSSSSVHNAIVNYHDLTSDSVLVSGAENRTMCFRD